MSAARFRPGLIPLGLVATLMAGCVVAPPPRPVASRPPNTTIVEEDRYYVREAPPPPPREVLVRAPSPRHEWVPGRWVWRNGWVWENGHWVERPGGYSRWIPGHWESGP